MHIIFKIQKLDSLGPKSCIFGCNKNVLSTLVCNLFPVVFSPPECRHLSSFHSIRFGQRDFFVCAVAVAVAAMIWSFDVVRQKCGTCFFCHYVHRNRIVYELQIIFA